MATNLFATPPTGGAGGSKPLVEFKAGKIILSAKKLTPDKRKGLVQLIQTPDSLMHFIWKDRTTGTVAEEDDLIIFPEDAAFKRIKQAPTGRVYLLEFKASSRKFFYWMQEATEEKDEEIVTKINQYINNPPSPGEQPQATGVDQNSLFQMLSGGSRPQQPTQPARSDDANVGLNDLQRILTGMGLPGSSISGLSQPSLPQSQSAPQEGAQQRQRVRLSQVMDPNVILPVLNNPTVQQQLMPFLPEEMRTPSEFNQLLSSPQFQQALDHFSDALQSGQLGELLRQFGLPTSGPTSVEQFLQAVQQSAQKQQSEKKDDKKDDKKDGDHMDTK
jgi:hypothetical protein